MRGCLLRGKTPAPVRAEHLARRKEIYEALHPETKHGGAPGKAGGGKEPLAKSAPSASFAKDTAARTGLSTRTIYSDVQIARKLAPDVKEAPRDTSLADSKRNLLLWHS